MLPSEFKARFKRSLLLIFLTVAAQFIAQAAAWAELPQCSALFSEENPFKPWSLADITTVENLQANQFLPESFLQKLQEDGREVAITSKPIMNIFGNGLMFEFRDSKKDLVANFGLWKGSQEDRVILERLRLEDPTSNRENLKPAQNKKGLPGNVFYFARNSIFSFMKAGGFKKIEIPSSENFLTYMLYSRVIGGKPATERARQMSEYLKDAVSLVVKDKILGEDKATIEDFSRHIGGYNEGSSFGWELGALWIKYKNDPAKLAENGIKLIGHSSNQPVAFVYKGRVVFFAPFLPDKPFLTWGSIHKKCPECMLMTRDLE
jgi:hypothetical protein